MSPRGIPWKIQRRSFPRVSGDEPTRNPAIYVDWQFSPRERG